MLGEEIVVDHVNVAQEAHGCDVLFKLLNEIPFMSMSLVLTFPLRMVKQFESGQVERVLRQQT